MKYLIRILMLHAFGLLLLSLGGCAFHTTARNWHGLNGADGRPTYYTSTTKVGFKLLVLMPFVGDVGVKGVVEDLTGDIAEAKGNNVRIVQGTSENYWYGFPPFTWIITPVVSTVTAEYKPDPVVYRDDQAEILKEEQKSNGLNPTKW